MVFTSQFFGMLARKEGILVVPSEYIAWDILDSRLIGDSDVNLGGGGVRYVDIEFNNDGTKVYMGEYSSHNPSKIHQFNLSTAWDVTTISNVATPIATHTLSGYQRQSRMCFNYDGTKLYIGARTDASSNPRLLELPLSTAYDLTTASNAGLKDININGIAGTLPYGPVYARDSTTGDEYLYYLTRQGNSAHLYVDTWQIGSPFDTNTTHMGSSSNFGSSSTTIDPDLSASELRHIAFIEPGGSNLWSMFSDNSTPKNLGLYRMEMSTPYDGSTATITTDYLKINRPYGYDDATSVTVSSDGLKMFWTDYLSDIHQVNIYAMQVGVPQTDMCPLLGTLVSDGTVGNLAHGAEADFKYSDDGTYCVVLESVSSTQIDIHIHGLSTAYDTSTADAGTSSGSITIGASCYNVMIKDSTTLFVVTDTYVVYQVDLSSAWNAVGATATAVRTIPTTTGSWTAPTHADVLENGTNFTLLMNNIVRCWTLGTAWDFSGVTDTNYYHQNEDIHGSLSLSSDSSVVGFSSYSWVNSGKQVVMGARVELGAFTFDTSADPYKFSEVTKANMIDYQVRFFESLNVNNYYTFQFPKGEVTSGTRGVAVYTSGTPYDIRFS